MAEVNPEMKLLLAKPEVARLVKARPHWFPPSINPPFEYENGVAVRKRTDATPMTDKVWKENGCDVVHWSVIIVESAPNGLRQVRKDGKPATVSMAFGGKGIWEHCFANCMVCWRSRERDFFDSKKMAHPYRVDIDNPTMPQLGCCGCVVCNKCVLRELKKNPGKKLLSCPYCAKKESFNRDVKAWMLSEDVFEEGH
jgi:hypothetical protein